MVHMVHGMLDSSDAAFRRSPWSMTNHGHKLYQLNSIDVFWYYVILCDINMLFMLMVILADVFLLQDLCVEILADPSRRRLLSACPWEEHATEWQWIAEISAAEPWWVRHSPWNFGGLWWFSRDSSGSSLKKRNRRLGSVLNPLPCRSCRGNSCDVYSAMQYP